MPLLINKDGKQLGPYSMEEARALVLSGQLDADDWAWPDGAKDWIALKDVPGFAASGGAARQKPATPPAGALEEETLWKGHPSQWLNFRIYLGWVIVLVLTLTLGLVYADRTIWVALAFGAAAVFALVHIVWAYVSLHAVQYVVTSQRVRVISGIFSKDISEIELFRVKDTMAHQSFLLRLFGLGTITILSGDERMPRLVLTGIPGALDLRERLRQEVMVLRQRFGVRELDVM
jgi:membrane protein YdbS with pleckstrin-like domain